MRESAGLGVRGRGYINTEEIFENLNSKITNPAFLRLLDSENGFRVALMSQ